MHMFIENQVQGGKIIDTQDPLVINLELYLALSFQAGKGKEKHYKWVIYLVNENKTQEFLRKKQLFLTLWSKRYLSFCKCSICDIIGICWGFGRFLEIKHFKHMRMYIECNKHMCISPMAQKVKILQLKPLCTSL